jgi:hypothetical protein
MTDAAAPVTVPRVDGVLDLVERIGADRALVPDELGVMMPAATAALPAFWAAYMRHWGGFCGARLDPMFSALRHPACQTGSLRIASGESVVIVGTGPSLAPALPALRRLRRALHLVTSPRGAEALAEAGVVPDLVVIEHQTALDAQFSVGERTHRPSRALADVPLVATDARTPAALVDDVLAERLFVPDPLPTWGLWPATAVALALAAGAARVGLVGIDLGTRTLPDAAQVPLADLLGLLAGTAAVPCVDLGATGAMKAGWTPGTLEALAAGGPVAPLTLAARPWLTPSARHERAVDVWRRATPLVAEAADALAAAVAVRDGDRSPRACGRLVRALDALLAAGAAPRIRADVQEGLGASFLPRYWRTAPERSRGPSLWRAVALASHELVQQHRTLGAVLERAA